MVGKTNETEGRTILTPGQPRRCVASNLRPFSGTIGPDPAGLAPRTLGHPPDPGFLTLESATLMLGRRHRGRCLPYCLSALHSVPFFSARTTEISRSRLPGSGHLFPFHRIAPSFGQSFWSRQVLQQIAADPAVAGGPPPRLA